MKIYSKLFDIQIILGKDPALKRKDPRAFVLAIFEIEEGYDVPEDKTTLVKLLKEGIVIPFHAHWCLSCHQIPKVILQLHEF